MTYIKKLNANDSSLGESAFVLSCSNWGSGGRGGGRDLGYKNAEKETRMENRLEVHLHCV